MELEGIWWNELGSMMEIETDDDGPKSFRGWYHTNVGNAQEQKYPLLGRCDVRGFESKMVDFVVAWNADQPDEGTSVPNPSVTAWCGQLQCVDDQEVITTTWLLDRLTDLTDDWESTLFGMDYFTWVQPSARLIEAARKQGRAYRALP